MENEEKKPKTEKPKIDAEQVKKLAALHCDNQEIAAFFDVSVSTITHKFAEVVRKGRMVGKMRLRQLQWKQAEDSYAMAIWLGKQYLGQRDKQELEVGGELKGLNIYIPKKDKA